MTMRGDTAIAPADFQPAFLVVAAISAVSVLIFMRLPKDAGAVLTSRQPLPADAVKQPITHEVRDQRVA